MTGQLSPRDRRALYFAIAALIIAGVLAVVYLVLPAAGNG